MSAWVVALAASPWALLVLFGCCLLDGLFPPVPSETLVITLAALAASGHGPHPLAVVAVAAVGAFAGDRTAYELGRRMPRGRLPFVPRDRAEHLLDHAADHLERRGAACLLAARWLPVGRVAVNVGAGMVGFPVRRYTAYAGVASVLWALWTVGLGLGAGAAFAGHPVLAVVAGVVGGLVVGLGVDAVLRCLRQPKRTMRRSRAPRNGPASSSGSSSRAASSSAASSAASRSGSSE